MEEYNPKFFNAEDFEGIIKIIETMIDTKGQNATSPENAAQRIDSFLSQVDSPSLPDLKVAIDVIDSWYLPLLLDFKFGRFSKLSLENRRSVIKKIIYPKGLFKLIAVVKAGARDAARVLKLLSCVGYYGSEEGMKQVGYKPVENRKRFDVINQKPIKFKDPF